MPLKKLGGIFGNYAGNHQGIFHMAQKSFIAACREYFGFKPGQSLTEFGAEIKELSYEDKLELAEGMRKHGGIDVADPTQAS